jgi:hypothetical protein
MSLDVRVPRARRAVRASCLLVALAQIAAAQQGADDTCADLPAPVTSGTRLDLGPATLHLPAGWTARLSRGALQMRDAYLAPVTVETTGDISPYGQTLYSRVTRGDDAYAAVRAAATSRQAADQRTQRPVTSTLRDPRGREVTLTWLPRGIDAISAPVAVGTRDACLGNVEGATIRVVRIERPGTRGSVHEIVVHPAGGGTGAVLLSGAGLDAETVGTLVAIGLGVRPAKR